MKIGFFTDSYVPRVDGIAISVETFRHELENLGHEVYVFAPKPGKEYDDEGKRIWRFVSWPSPWYEGFRDSWPYTVKNAKHIRELDLDIIHVHTFNQIGLLGTYMAKTDNIPLVTTVHADLDLINEYGKLTPALFVLGLAVSVAARKRIPLSKAMKVVRPKRKVKEWRRNFVQEMVDFYNQQCDLVIAPSPKIKNMLKTHETATAIEVVPTGINPEELNTDESPDSLSREFGLNEAETIIQFSGRLVKEKNAGLVLEAFSMVYGDFPGAYLLIVGAGPEQPRLEAKAKELGINDRVIFTGRIPRTKVYALLQLADIYAHACLRETQGLVINEAAAAGKPIVLVDPLVAEVVEDGVNGYVSENNPVDYAAKLRLLLADENLRSEFGAKSLEFSRVFDSGAQARKLAGLYTETLATKSKSAPVKQKISQK